MTTQSLDTRAEVPTFTRFVCGTRSIEPFKPFQVVCATCGCGGTIKHRTREEATHACVRDSNRPCLTCGAR